MSVWHNKRVLTKARVHALRKVSGQLEVLTLVLSNGNQCSVIKQDVRSHENWVGEQADARSFITLLSRLVLELGHAPGLTKSSLAGQNPREFRVLGNV